MQMFLKKLLVLMSEVSDLPKLQKSKYAEFLDCISENIRICCKVFGVKKIAEIFGVSVSTVYNRIDDPINISAANLFRLSEYLDKEVADLIKPLEFAGKR